MLNTLILNFNSYDFITIHVSTNILNTDISSKDCSNNNVHSTQNDILCLNIIINENHITIYNKIALLKIIK